MDPLPFISRAFSLVAQEEQQRSIVSSATGSAGSLVSGNVAFAVHDKHSDRKSTMRPQRRDNNPN